MTAQDGMPFAGLGWGFSGVTIGLDLESVVYAVAIVRGFTRAAYQLS